MWQSRAKMIKELQQKLAALQRELENDCLDEATLNRVLDEIEHLKSELETYMSQVCSVIQVYTSRLYH